MFEDVASDGRWGQGPILPELPLPPADRIAVRGAQRLRVYNVDAPNPGSRGGFTEAVALAWARLPDGDWAALLAWLSGWQQGARITGRGRFAWCRILQDRTKAMPIWPQQDPDYEWFGQHRDSEFVQAVRNAAATLPEHLREAALTPYEDPGGAVPNWPAKATDEET